MTLKMSDVEWEAVEHKPKDGPAVNVKGDIKAATFTCTCRNIWHATASRGLGIGVGLFARTYSSITVDCPACKLRWHVPREDYAGL